MAATALSFNSFQPQTSSSLSSYGVEHHHQHHHSSSISRSVAHSVDQNHNHLSSSPQLSRPSHTCPSCSRPFSRAEHLERHLATHLPSNSSKCFVCQSCLKGFTRKDVLKRHIRAVHERKRSDIRRSRRRSCKRCAGFKIKCTGIGRNLNVDGTGTADEACEACKKRGVECVYDFRATVPEIPSTGNSSPQDSYACDDYTESDPSRRGSAGSTEETKFPLTGYCSEPTTPSTQSISISSMLHLKDASAHTNRQLESEPRTTTDEDRHISTTFQSLLSSPSSTSNRQLSSSSRHHMQQLGSSNAATSSLPVSFLVNGSSSTKEAPVERNWGHSRTVIVGRNDLTRPRAASDAALHIHNNNGDVSQIDGYNRRDTMTSDSFRHNIDYDRTGQSGRLETSLSRPPSSHYSTFSPSFGPNNSAPPPPPPPPPPQPRQTSMASTTTTASASTSSQSNPLYPAQISPVSDHRTNDSKPVYHRTHSSSSDLSSTNGIIADKPTPAPEYLPAPIFQNTYPHAPRPSVPQHQQAGQWVWQPAGTAEHEVQRVTLPPLRHLLNACDRDRSSSRDANGSVSV